MSELDKIERVVERSGVGVANHLERSAAGEIDRLKLLLVNSLLIVRRLAQLAIQLPSSLSTEHFYSVDTANEPPDVDSFLGTDPRDSPTKRSATKEVRTVTLPEASEVGYFCKRTHSEIAQGLRRSDISYKDDMMRAIRLDVFKGLVNDPMARIHFGLKEPVDDRMASIYGGSRLKEMLEDSLTEIREAGVETFLSGSIVWLFRVLPEHSRDVYAIVVDEKFPEFFGLYHRALPEWCAAKLAWESIVHFKGERNQRLGAALVEDGWTQLVPQCS